MSSFDFILAVGLEKERLPQLELSPQFKSVLKNVDYEVLNRKNDFFEICLLNWKETSAQVDFSEDIIIVKIGKVFLVNESLFSVGSRREISSSEIRQLSQKYNSGFIKHIKGLFVVLIVDTLKKRVFAYCSKSGFYRLYYHHSNGQLLLSSSVDSIIHNCGYKHSVNPTALIEKSIFGYPIGQDTLFDEVTILDNHSYLDYSVFEDSLSVTKYHDLGKLIDERVSLDWGDTYRETPILFNAIMDSYLENQVNATSALTAGFDSRTILSRAIDHKDKVLFYSWGATDNSIEVSIPKQLSKILGFEHLWIELGEELVENNDFFIYQHLLLSDGSAHIKRSHNMFSFARLAEHSRLTFTGVGGSELLRPNNSMATNITKPIASIVFRDKLAKDIISQVIPLRSNVFNDKMYSQYRDSVIEDVYRTLSDVMIHGQAYMNLYHFTLKSSMWRFFGQEIHAVRVHNAVLTPFIDDDFIEFILKTPVPSMNKSAFKRSARDLRLGQLFYLPIIRENEPILAKYPTGRGYSPMQLTSKAYPCNLLMPYIMHVIKQKYVYKRATYHSSQWNSKSVLNDSDLMKRNDSIFNASQDSQNPDEYSLKKYLSLYPHVYNS